MSEEGRSDGDTQEGATSESAAPAVHPDCGEDTAGPGPATPLLTQGRPPHPRPQHLQVRQQPATPVVLCCVLLQLLLLSPPSLVVNIN